MASGPITSWQTDRETVETVADFIFLGNYGKERINIKKYAHRLDGNHHSVGRSARLHLRPYKTGYR